MSNKRAFTLIELVITISIIVALTSIIVPNFLSTTEHSKLKSDIQTALIVHNAIELYKMENGSLPEVVDSASLIAALKESDYVINVELTPQLAFAQWRYDATMGKLMLDITDCSAEVRRLADALMGKESQYVYK